mgnify:CR=1 FL=1
MMRILVRRDTGDRLAPAIYDDLCCAQAPCVSRGRNFLYSELSHLEYVLDLVWRDQEGALSVDYRLTLQRYPKNGE